MRFIPTHYLRPMHSFLFLRYHTTSGFCSTRSMVEGLRSSWDRMAAHRCPMFEARASRLSPRGCEQGLCLSRLQPPRRVTLLKFLFYFYNIPINDAHFEWHLQIILRLQRCNFTALTTHLKISFSYQKMQCCSWIIIGLSKIDKFFELHLFSIFIHIDILSQY